MILKVPSEADIHRALGPPCKIPKSFGVLKAVTIREGPQKRDEVSSRGFPLPAARSPQGPPGRGGSRLSQQRA